MTSIQFSQIENSDTLLKFYETNPHTIDNIKNYLKINNIETELISNIYKGSNKNMIWKCHCGDYFKTTWTRFYCQNQIRCKKCSKVKSTIENKTETWLKNNSYNYSYQFWFKECKDKKVLPFDFAVFNNDNKLVCLIETDGKQHYEKVKWSELMTNEEVEKSFESTQYHDKLKDKYCEDNNIPLLRIPYWEFNNNNYINILKEKLK